MQASTTKDNRMRPLILTLLLCCTPLVVLPVPCLAGEQPKEDDLRSLSFHIMGMMKPQSIHVWQRHDRVLMQVDYKGKTYRREADAALMQALDKLARKHGIAAWSEFKNAPLSDGIQMLDGDSFSLEAFWASGKHLAIYGSTSRPEGYHAFESELMNLWEEAVHRFPHEAPTEIHSNNINLFTFTEQLEKDENSWLLVCAYDCGSYVTVRICRGKKNANTQTCYKVSPAMLEKLNALVKQHKLLLWNDKTMLDGRNEDTERIPHARFHVKYYPASTAHDEGDYGAEDCEESFTVAFSPDKRRAYEALRKELLALIEDIEQGTAYSQGKE